jgi:hypothetical protein
MKVLCQREYADIIAWLPDGKSFTIVRPKAFVADILPDHFEQAKYSSFTRRNCMVGVSNVTCEVKRLVHTFTNSSSVGDSISSRR